MTQLAALCKANDPSGARHFGQDLIGNVDQELTNPAVQALIPYAGSLALSTFGTTPDHSYDVVVPKDNDKLRAFVEAAAPLEPLVLTPYRLDEIQIEKIDQAHRQETIGASNGTSIIDEPSPSDGSGRCICDHG